MTDVLDFRRLACTFDPQSHTYFAGGRIIPSVSEVLRHVAFQGQFLARDAERYLRRGSIVHKMCEGYDRGAESTAVADSELLPRVQAWATARRWCGWDSFAAIEQPLASVVHGFAGTPDRIYVAETAQEVQIIDLKMSHSGWLSVRAQLQLGAYAALVREAMDETWPIVGVIVELRPTGVPKITRYDEDSMKVATRAFLGALDVYQWLRVTTE